METSSPFLRCFNKTDTDCSHWQMAPGDNANEFDYSKVLINWGGQGTYFNPQFASMGWIRWWSRQGIRPK